MLFIILWLISPIVLLVLYLVQLSANSDLKRNNKALNEQVNALLSQLAQSVDNNTPDTPAQDTEAVPEKADIPAQPPVVPVQQSTPYQLPQQTIYDIPPAAAQPVVQEQPAPQPVSQPAQQTSPQPVSKPEPVYAQKIDIPAAPKPRKKISTINIILILGALFLSLSGFIFAAATWGVLNSFFKAVVLVSFSALFFGIHSFTERKLKLEQTGRIFYILGSVFLPAAVVAAGLLEVFGHYLSFYGDGRLLLFAILALSVCIPFFKGAHDYKNKFFAAVSHYSFSAAVIFILFHVIPRADIAVLASAIYSLLIVVAEPFIKDFYDDIFGENNVFSSQYGYFSLISTTLLGIISTCVFLDDTFSVVTLFAFAVYSACFLTKSVTEKNGIFSSIAFAFFITISLFSGFDPDDISSVTCVIASTALIYATLSAMGLLPEIIRKIMKGFAIAAAGIAGLLAVIENINYLVDNSVPSWEMVLASGVVFAEMVILALRYKSSEFRAFTFAALLWFVTDLMLIFEIGLAGILISFAIVTAYFLVTRFTPLKNKLYCGINDIVFAVYTIINSVCCCIDSDAGCFAAIAVLAVGIVCVIICRSEKLSAILCPILTFQTALPLFLIFMEYDVIFPYAMENGDSAMSVILIFFCIIATILMFIPKAASYTKSYLIFTYCLLPVFVISCLIWESADFVTALAVCALYLVSALSPAKDKLSNPVFDISFSVFTLICSIICCCVETENSIGAIAVLAASVVCLAVARRGKISEVFCPVFTFQLALPLYMLFKEYEVTLPHTIDSGDSAMSVIIILFCILASLFLFVPKAINYAKSYGISLLCILPVFIISCIVWESADFVSMLAICVYIAVFLARYSFPKEQFSHVNILNGAILLTSLLAGFKFLDDLDYLVCFPAVAIMLIFAVYAMGEAFDVFRKVNPHICTFLWFAAPLFSSWLFIAGADTGEGALMIFAALLAVCSAFTSVIRKNTLNLIIPVLIIPFALAELYVEEMQIVPLIILVAAGRILFNDKMIKKLYVDVFSIGAFLPVVVFFFEASDDFNEWAAILVTALLILNLVRKGNTSVTNRRTITAAGIFIFPLFWVQPFFEVPELINVQFNLLPVFFFCLLVKLIWKDAAEKADNFSFIAAIISLVILFIESFASSDSFDAVFIGVVLFIMLAVSFIIKKKRWFVLAVTSMVASGILLSFGQRDSIAWLVYLALAGAALIALGLANELKKQQQKTGEETKLSRFMSDWTW